MAELFALIRRQPFPPSDARSALRRSQHTWRCEFSTDTSRLVHERLYIDEDGAELVASKSNKWYASDNREWYFLFALQRAIMMAVALPHAVESLSMTTISTRYRSPA